MAESRCRYNRSSAGGGGWQIYRSHPQFWTIGYRDLKFKISPTGFKHTGLFPEQAVNWDFFREKIEKAGRPIRVLNLFAYTGGATLACAAAGASVCHVDASKGMVAWARENQQLSGLGEKPIRWIVDDCQKFVEREIRRGSLYDGVIMDPPSYGRGPGGEVWKLEDSVYDLVKLCAGVLTENPLFFAINSYTTGLSPSVMEYILNTTVSRRFAGKGTTFSSEIGLPVTATAPCLAAPPPCGTAGSKRGRAGRRPPAVWGASGRSPLRRLAAGPAAGASPCRSGQSRCRAARHSRDQDYEKSEERILKKLIETEHISFSYEEETGLPLVLEDVNITIGKASLWRCWGTMAPGNPPLPSTAMPCCCPPHRHRNGGRYGYQG